MQIASRTVVDGRVELDSDVSEAASVTVIAFDGDETFEADPETSIAQCERTETVSVGQLLSELSSLE
jgi:hypothetical protein